MGANWKYITDSLMVELKCTTDKKLHDAGFSNNSSG